MSVSDSSLAAAKHGDVCQNRVDGRLIQGWSQHKARVVAAPEAAEQTL